MTVPSSHPTPVDETVPVRVCQARAVSIGVAAKGYRCALIAYLRFWVRLCFAVRLLVGSAQLSSPREVAIVLVVRDCSQHIPSRVTVHVCREQLCMVVADAYISGANSSP